MWDALSHERTGLPFTIAAGPRQGGHSRVCVPWDSRPYSTASDSRLPFSSLPTTRRTTVEVFDPASTRNKSTPFWSVFPVIQHIRIHGNVFAVTGWLPRIHFHGNVFADSFPSNGSLCLLICIVLWQIYEYRNSIPLSLYF
jgi:hypothetical protein